MLLGKNKQQKTNTNGRDRTYMGSATREVYKLQATDFSNL